VSVLHEFNRLDGGYPTGELVELADGTIIGTTYGSLDWSLLQFGTVFSMSPGGGFTTLHRFGWLDGTNPFRGLTLASNGGLYGTTVRGGPGGAGVVFRIEPPVAAGTREQP
jgi:uncharacterized repeat protein (TIGR03803 family)